VRYDFLAFRRFQDMNICYKQTSWLQPVLDVWVNTRAVRELLEENAYQILVAS
jgi:hypothetical protein